MPQSEIVSSPESSSRPPISHRITIIDDDPDVTTSLTHLLNSFDDIPTLTPPETAASFSALFHLLDRRPLHSNGADIFFVDLHLGTDYYVSGGVTGGAEIVRRIKQPQPEEQLPHTNPDSIIIVFSVEDMGLVKTSFRVNNLPYTASHGVYFLNKQNATPDSLGQLLKTALLNWGSARLALPLPPLPPGDFDQQHTQITLRLFSTLQKAWDFNHPENITAFYQALAAAEQFINGYSQIDPQLVQEAQKDAAAAWAQFIKLAQSAATLSFTPPDTKLALLTQAVDFLPLNLLQHLALLISHHPEISDPDITVFYQSLAHHLIGLLEQFQGNPPQFTRIIGITQLALSLPLSLPLKHRFLERLLPTASHVLLHPHQAEALALAVVSYPYSAKLVELLEQAKVNQSTPLGNQIIQKLIAFLQQANSSSTD